MVQINATRDRLALATLVNSVFIDVQANMAAAAHRTNMGIVFTNRKLPSIYSESVTGSRSKANTLSNAEKSVCYGSISV